MGDAVEPRAFVFVYGTLMHGEDNHRLLADATYLGEHKLHGPYRMVSFGCFPAVLPGEGGRKAKDTDIIGEIYAVDSKTLHRVDSFEGHPNHYHRTMVTVDGTRSWVHMLPPSQARQCPVIASGDWRTYHAQSEAARKARSKMPPPLPKDLKQS